MPITALVENTAVRLVVRENEAVEAVIRRAIEEIRK